MIIKAEKPLLPSLQRLWIAVPCQSSCCKLPAATYLRPWLGLRAASWAKREKERRKKDAQTDANLNNIFVLFL